MKSNDRRLYKRIIAILLVVLLILPQGISSIVSNAATIEGMTVSAPVLSKVEGGYTASVNIESTVEGTDLSTGYSLDFYIDGKADSIGSASITVDESDHKKGTATSAVLTAQITKTDKVKAVVKASNGDTAESASTQSTFNYPPAEVVIKNTAPIVNAESGEISISVDNEDGLTTISDCSYTVAFTDINGVQNNASGNVTAVNGTTASFTLTGTDKNRLKTDNYTVTVTQGTVTATITEINNYALSIVKDAGVAEVIMNSASVGDSVMINKHTSYQFVIKASQDSPLFDNVSLDGASVSYSEDASGSYKVATVDLPADVIDSNRTLSITTKSKEVSAASIRANNNGVFYPGYIYGYEIAIGMDPSAAEPFVPTFSSNSEYVTINNDGTFTINKDAHKNSKFKLIMTLDGTDYTSSEYTISTEALTVKYYKNINDKKLLYTNNDGSYANDGSYIEGSVNSENYSDYYIGSGDSITWKQFTDSDKSGNEYVFTDGIMHSESFYVKARAYKNKATNNDDNSNNMVEANKEVLIDGTAPTFDASVVSYDANNNVITSGAPSKKVIEVSDDEDPKIKNAENTLVNGSGVKSIKYIKKAGVYTKDYAPSDSDSNLIEMTDKKVPFTSMEEETTYVIYVFDNVGNVSGKEVTITPFTPLSLDEAIITGKEKEDGENYLKKGETVTFVEKGMITDGEAANVADDSEDFYKQVIKVNNSIVTVTEGSNAFEGGIITQTTTNETVGQKRSFVISFSEDGEYNVEVSVWDPSVSKAIVKTISVVYDTKAPVISFEDRVKSQSTQQIISNGNSNLQVVKTVTDERSGLKKYLCTVTRADKADGTKDLLSNYEKDFTGDKSYTDDKKVTEGHYILTYKAEDRSGNITTIDKNIVFDVSSPTYSGYKVEPTSSDGQTNKTYTDYQYFDKSNIKVTINVKDIVSGIKDIVVKKNNVVIDRTLTTTKNGNGKAEISGATFDIPTTYKGQIGITITDEAGNTTDATLDSSKFVGVITENGSASSSVELSTSPITAQTFTENGVSTEYYNKSNSKTVKIASTDSISGIKKIVIANIDNKKTLSTKDYTGKNKITTSSDESIDLSEEGEYTVQATLTDNAGNVISSNTKRMILDYTAPTISSNVDSVAQEFNNADVSVNITITEKYLNPDNTTVTVYKNGSATTYPASFTTNGDINTASIPFNDDGDYYFTVESTDKAGNKSQLYQSKEFTIDKTNPRLTLTFNNNDVRNEKYYNSERIGTLTVEEHNFDASKVTVKVDVTDSAEGVGTPAVGGFSTSGDTHQASIPFTGDATYQITVTAEDQAGNAADQTITESFVVDLTDPEINISNVEEDKLYSGTVNPDIEVTDRNYDSDGTKITLVSSRNNGAAGKDLEDSYTASSIADGERFSYSNFKKEEDNDDYYVIKAVAEDLAGNTSEETIGFMVNRFGSYFTLNDYTSGIVDAIYTNLEGDEDIEIAAHNLADIDESTVYFTVGEDTQTLEENNGYTVSIKKGDDHWNVSTYTFDKSLFESEGEYNIVVSTKDSEGNVADNESKETPVKFVIDRTAPEYVINGVEDGQNYEDVDSVSGNIELHDNIGVAKAVVTIDGTASEYEGKDLDDMNYSIPVDFEKGSHTVKVKVYDVAGNESVDDNGISFSVNQNALERNLWWIIALIVAALAVGLIIFFVVKGRRDEKA